LCHVALKLAETSVVKSRPSVPYGANLLFLGNFFAPFVLCQCRWLVGDAYCYDVTTGARCITWTWYWCLSSLLAACNECRRRQRVKRPLKDVRRMREHGRPIHRRLDLTHVRLHSSALSGSWPHEDVIVDSTRSCVIDDVVEAGTRVWFDDEQAHHCAKFIRYLCRVTAHSNIHAQSQSDPVKRSSACDRYRCYNLNHRVPCSLFALRNTRNENAQLTVLHWLQIRRILAAFLVVCSVLFFSRPQSEGWPHHGHTFFIFISVLCRSDWLFHVESGSVYLVIDPYPNTRYTLYKFATDTGNKWFWIDLIWLVFPSHFLYSFCS